MDFDFWDPTDPIVSPNLQLRPRSVQLEPVQSHRLISTCRTQGPKPQRNATRQQPPYKINWNCFSPIANASSCRLCSSPINSTRLSRPLVRLELQSQSQSQLPVPVFQTEIKSIILKRIRPISSNFIRNPVSSVSARKRKQHECLSIHELELISPDLT